MGAISTKEGAWEESPHKISILNEGEENELRYQMIPVGSVGTDIEYKYPWGWGELEGIANRTNFDLGRHSEASGTDLTYFDEESKERYIPYVIEPSGGVDRATLAFWLDAYDEEPDGDNSRTVLHLNRHLSPISIAVLPLSRTERLTPTARHVYDTLRKTFSTQYDDAQSIGRRYRRQDEIGTPYCVTVDFDSLEDH